MYGDEHPRLTILRFTSKILCLITQTGQKKNFTVQSYEHFTPTFRLPTCQCFKNNEGFGRSDGMFYPCVCPIGRELLIGKSFKYFLHLLTISLSLQNKTSFCWFRLLECQYKTLYHSKCDGVFLLEHLVCYPYFRSFLSENYSKMAFWIYLPQKLQIFAPQPTANGRDVRIVLKPGLAGHVICSKRIFHPLVPPSGHAFAIIFHSELFASTYLNSWNSY